MHELSVCQAILDEVGSLAAKRSAISVSGIHLSVGPLSGVESGLLHQAFPLATAGTVAAGAELHIRETPVRIRCSRCDAEMEVPPNRLLCRHCDGWQTDLLSGDELVLDRVEMQCKGEEGHADV